MDQLSGMKYYRRIPLDLVAIAVPPCCNHGKEDSLCESFQKRLVLSGQCLSRLLKGHGNPASEFGDMA